MTGWFPWPAEASSLGGSFLASLAMALALRHSLLSPEESRLGELLRKRRELLGDDLLFIRSKISAIQVQVLQAFCVVVGFFLFMKEPLWGGLVAAASLLPPLLIRRARGARALAVEVQVEGWLASLSRALEAAPSLGEALEVSASSCDAPMKEELALVLSQIGLGRPLDRALSAWSERVGSRVLTLSVAILQVGRHTGGRLPDVLKSGAASLREMERLEGVLRTKTAEGRAQTWVISVVPVPLYLAVQASDPSYFLPLETTATGHLFLGIAAALWMAAIFSARKILAVEI